MTSLIYINPDFKFKSFRLFIILLDFLVRAIFTTPYISFYRGISINTEKDYEAGIGWIVRLAIRDKI
jgi:uncharacterized membrane protein YfhO